MTDNRQLVVTVHGINSDGEWQESVEQILRFHFRCENYKYQTYRYCGGLLIFLGPWGLLACAFCLSSYWGRHLNQSRAIAALCTGVGLLLAFLMFIGKRIPACREMRARLVIIVWPLALLLLTASLGIYLTVWFPRGALPWSAVLSCSAAAFLLAAVGEAIWRRRREARRFAIWVHDRARGARGINFIAHSFGTYLTGTILLYNLKPPTNGAKINQARRIVLAGSVLPVNYSWAGLTYANPRPFHQVRNEAGGRDLVVRLAGIAQSILPHIGIGDAGLRGFEGAPELIHTVNDDPLGFCQRCPTPIEKRMRRVHNVLHPTFFHSDALSGCAQAQTFWLPFLWGLDSWEYWDFRQLCSAASAYYRKLRRFRKLERRLHRDAAQRLRARRREVRLGLKSVEKQLDQRVWHWVESRCGIGKSYGSYLAFQIAYRVLPRAQSPQQVLQWTEQAIRRVWINVVRAQEEQSRANADRSLVRLLHPEAAGERAITEVLA